MTLPLALVGIGSVAVLNAVVACYSFAGTLLLSAGVLLVDVVRHRDPPPTVRTGPEVAAVVPAYGDPDVIHLSVESLLGCDYEDLTVYVVCEPGDGTTLEAAAEFAERDRVVRLVNDRNPGSKAAAIDYPVAETESDLGGV